jgi:hypothetical protein
MTPNPVTNMNNLCFVIDNLYLIKKCYNVFLSIPGKNL